MNKQNFKLEKLKVCRKAKHKNECNFMFMKTFLENRLQFSVISQGVVLH